MRIDVFLHPYFQRPVSHQTTFFPHRIAYPGIFFVSTTCNVLQLFAMFKPFKLEVMNLFLPTLITLYTYKSTQVWIRGQIHRHTLLYTYTNTHN